MLHGVGCRHANNTIKANYALGYSRRLIARFNREEENAEVQKRNTVTGTIKVSGLIHNRSKQSDPSLAWDMFHKIYHMYSYIKNKEETNVAFFKCQITKT